ncbi:hypothetical protein DUNSADRAFT_9681 [Dunaliella salina]|uniref:Uncharacterized protein n=1 Tax=Dunaliella salina TaxID=3046 RepID=A0ABQ7GH08_DUNSA|nr:hypothetical protein DUNSADRAFT_9681 [Dunaliella salina]|eukprot:KAF5833886.1 hypothetical protein DUNSADRAFT_9681 [Dunaliella salina]
MELQELHASVGVIPQAEQTHRGRRKGSKSSLEEGSSPPSPAGAACAHHGGVLLPPTSSSCDPPARFAAFPKQANTPRIHTVVFHGRTGADNGNILSEQHALDGAQRVPAFEHLWHVLVDMVKELKAGCQGLRLISCEGHELLPGSFCLTWPSCQDTCMAAGIRSLLARWYPPFNRRECHKVLGPLHLQRACATAWASLEAQSAQRGASGEVVSLVCSVVGQQPCLDMHAHMQAQHREGKAQLGAAGLPWLVQLQWRASKRPGMQSGQAPHAGECTGCEVVLTDGLGIFLVVLVQHLGLLRARRGGKRTEAFARQEDKRRYERRRAIRAAVAAAQAFQRQHPSQVVHAFAGVCLSHAEGLDIVAPAGGSEAKEQQMKLAHALIPSLRTGPMLNDKNILHSGPFSSPEGQASLLSMLLEGEGERVSLHSRYGRLSSSANSRRPTNLYTSKKHGGSLARAPEEQDWTSTAWLAAGMLSAGLVVCSLGFVIYYRRPSQTFVCNFGVKPALGKSLLGLLRLT